MKRNIFMAVVAACLLSACSENQKTASDDSAQHDRDSLMAELSQRDAEFDEIMNVINEINQGFQQINEAQGRVTTTVANGEGDNMTAQIQDNMQFIQTTLQQNKEQIAQLKARLKGSALASSKLKETIDQLSAQMEEKSAQIEQLQADLAAKDIKIAEQGEQINTLNENVKDLSASNEEKNKQVAAQDKELNRAWFAFGTKKELKEQNILNKKEVLKDGSFNRNYFTEIDIRNQKEIKLYSKSAQLLTSHPNGSYTLAKDSKGQFVLKINNPNTFWSVSRYLVVMVK